MGSVRPRYTDTTYSDWYKTWNSKKTPVGGAPTYELPEWNVGEAPSYKAPTITDVPIYKGPSYREYPTYTAPTWNEAEVSSLTQQRAAPGLRALRQQVSRIAGANYDSPNVKRMTLREALTGYGSGLGDVMGSASSTAMGEYGTKFGITSANVLSEYRSEAEAAAAYNAYAADVAKTGFEGSMAEWQAKSTAAMRGAELEYGGQMKEWETAAEAGRTKYLTAAEQAMQAERIASAEKITSLTLAESRAAQERGISAASALEDKRLAAALQMQTLTFAEQRAAQERGISAELALQEKNLASAKELQRLGIISNEKLAQLSRDFQQALATFNAAMQGAGLAYEGDEISSFSNRQAQWQLSFDKAMAAFYAGSPKAKPKGR